MEDYIKKKKKTQQKQIPVEIGPQIIIRQAGNQISDLNLKLDVITNRIETLRRSLTQAFLELDTIKQKGSLILGTAPGQKPQLENTVSNRQTSDAKPNLQQTKQLEGTEIMVEKITNKQFKRIRDQTVNDQLSQAGLSDARTKNTRKRVKMVN